MVATASHQATALPLSRPTLIAPIPAADRSAAAGFESPGSIGRN